MFIKSTFYFSSEVKNYDSLIVIYWTVIWKYHLNYTMNTYKYICFSFAAVLIFYPYVAKIKSGFL